MSIKLYIAAVDLAASLTAPVVPLLIPRTIFLSILFLTFSVSIKLSNSLNLLSKLASSCFLNDFLVSLAALKACSNAAGSSESASCISPLLVSIFKSVSLLANVFDLNSPVLYPSITSVVLFGPFSLTILLYSFSTKL